MIFDISILQLLMHDCPLLILVALNIVWFSRHIMFQIMFQTGRTFLLAVSESFTLVIYEFAIFCLRQWLQIELWFDFYPLDTDWCVKQRTCEISSVDWFFIPYALQKVFGFVVLFVIDEVLWIFFAWLGFRTFSEHGLCLELFVLVP